MPRGIHARHNAVVERLRRGMPLHKYLYLLHQAAVTGYLPTMTSAGELMPRDPDAPLLGNAERVKLLGYLVDKSMADPSPVPAESPPEAERLSLDDIRSMPREQLVDALRATTGDASMEVVRVDPADIDGEDEHPFFRTELPRQ
jgi:hypothetical protein